MTERLEQAYAKFDVALRELVAASDEASGTEDGWLVTDYVTVVGQQLFRGGQRVDSCPSVLFPFGSQPSWVTHGLLGAVDSCLVDVEAET